MLALPCCRRCCGSVDRDGGGAEGASATESEEPPLTASTAVCGGGGGEGEGGGCAEHVRHRPVVLRLRPPPSPRGGLTPRQLAAAHGRRNEAENIRE